MATVKIDVAPGEFFDRLTIATIKLEHATQDQAAEIRRRIGSFAKIRTRHFPPSPTLDELVTRLENINRTLWGLETEVRRFHHPLDGPDVASYIAVTRSIFSKNEARAAIKCEIDRLLQHQSIEAKIYTLNDTAAT